MPIPFTLPPPTVLLGARRQAWIDLAKNTLEHNSTVGLYLKSFHDYENRATILEAIWAYDNIPEEGVLRHHATAFVLAITFTLYKKMELSQLQRNWPKLHAWYIKNVEN